MGTLQKKVVMEDGTNLRIKVSAEIILYDMYSVTGNLTCRTVPGRDVLFAVAMYS